MIDADTLRRKLRALRVKLLEATLYWGGVSTLFQILRPENGSIILMYHSISDAGIEDFVDPENRVSREMFEQQMAFLSRHRCVVSLSELVAQIESNTVRPEPSVCITFDDGYLDNLRVAAPILAKYELPATLFLATGYVERGESQWADVLHWQLQRRTADRLHLPQLEIEEADLSASGVFRTTKGRLHAQLLGMGQPQRRALLSEIEGQLRPAGPAPRLTLTWDEVRELRSGYPLFDIGGHTRGHVDLRAHGGEAARGEIDGCLQDIRRELGIEPQHFSFPYGRWSQEARLMVAAAGWRSAVVAGPNPRVGRASDKLAMQRGDSPRSMTDLRFRTSGAYPGIFSALGLR